MNIQEYVAEYHVAKFPYRPCQPHHLHVCTVRRSVVIWYRSSAAGGLYSLPVVRGTVWSSRRRYIPVTVTTRLPVLLVSALLLDSDCSRGDGAIWASVEIVAIVIVQLLLYLRRTKCYASDNLGTSHVDLSIKKFPLPLEGGKWVKSTIIF